MSTPQKAQTNGQPVDRRVGGTFLPPVDGASRGTDYAAAPQWVANLQIERLLVLGMFVCLMWALGQALLSAGLSGPHVVSIGLMATSIFAAGIALGGRAEGRNLRRYTDYGITDWLLLLVPIIVLLKLLPSLLQGPGVAGAEIASWMEHPDRFWDASMVWSLILVFFVWDESLREAEDLSKLSLQPGEIPPPVNSPAYYDWVSSPYRFVDHASAWRRLMWRFVAGGFLVLFLTGLAIVEPAQLTNPDRPEVLGLQWHVLLYYLFGLVLAGQTSLDRLRTAWLRAGAVVQSGLARRWLAYGAALMGLALVLALVLPTSFTDQGAEQLPLFWRWLWLIRAPLGAVFGIFNWVIAHIAALLFAPILWLLPRGAAGGAAPVGGYEPLPPIEPVQPAPSGYPSPVSRIVWALLLYVAPAALAVYAIWNTWRKRHAIWEGLRSAWRDAFALLWGALLDLIAALWRMFSFGSPRLLNLAPEAIRARLRKPRVLGGGMREMGWLRLRGLSPRALIQYFYVSLVQRASAVGWERGKGQTAYEFSRRLAAHLPDRERELEVLTEAFVKAKYSPEPIEDTDAKRARGPWERLRAALQTRRRARQLGNWFGLGGD